jgi:hypothetical protein
MRWWARRNWPSEQFVPYRALCNDCTWTCTTADARTAATALKEHHRVHEVEPWMWWGQASKEELAALRQRLRQEAVNG